jgi:hypothetical protein
VAKPIVLLFVISADKRTVYFKIDETFAKCQSVRFFGKNFDFFVRIDFETGFYGGF